MHRFFIETEIKLVDDEQWFIIDDNLIHQCKNVLRIKSNEQIQVISNNKEYICLFLNDRFKILKLSTSRTEKNYKFILLSALPKNKNIDLIIQKCAELNVDELIFFQTKRSISKWTNLEFQNKKPRFEKIIKEASEQSNKINLMKVSFIESLNQIQNSPSLLKLIAFENATFNEKINTFEKQIKDKNEILLFIGPEGGFDQREISDFIKHNFTVVSFGEKILRTETAIFYGASVIDYIKGVN